jgi:hypothetical protein
MRSMGVATTLAAALGTYYGTGDGDESGPFLARIAVSALPNGGVALDYEATSHEFGLQHREHTLLIAGPGGRDMLYIAQSESAYVTTLVESAPGSGRFEEDEATGEYALAVVIEVPEPGQLSYAWWWGESGLIAEQSRADVALPADV